MCSHALDASLGTPWVEVCPPESRRRASWIEAERSNLGESERTRTTVCGVMSVTGLAKWVAGRLGVYAERAPGRADAQ